jgi:uncharacterized repeat protein (TIGR03803 family)
LKVNLVRVASAVFLFCAAEFIPSSAQTFTTLASFSGTNGDHPNSPLIQGSDGNFYGTTDRGGTSQNCDSGCGTVFRMTPQGALTTLHSFDSTDGSFFYGQGPLVEGSDGNFYGTTDSGGTSQNCGFGCGTVFSITPEGVLTTLHDFAGYPTEGDTPLGGLVQGKDGDFYGTTLSGGSSGACGSFGCGTVFKISSQPRYTLTTLHNFDGTDGEEPQEGLVLANDGNFYGTTLTGGINNGGAGTLFRMTPGGILTTLHSFNCPICIPDGGNPGAGLVQATSGSLYGTTVNGAGYGVVFTSTLGGILTLPHIFTGYPTDGANPEAVLVQGTDGNFYGTTYAGGNSNNCSPSSDGCGTVFQMTPTGEVTILHNFNNSDGSNPDAGLVQATDARFYGTVGYGTGFPCLPSG